MKNKKAMLAYVYSAKNAGDLAICIGAIDLLIEQSYDVVLLSKYDRNDPEYFTSKTYYEKRYGNRITVLEAPFTLNRKEHILKKLIHNFKGLSVFLGFPNSKDKLIREELEQCDLLIFNGGNLLRCSSLIDYVRLVALYYPVKLAKKLRKRYIIFPHSSAHINSMGRPLVEKIIKDADMVFAREEISHDKLKREFSLNNIHNSIDLAFFIKEGSRQTFEQQTSISKKVGFTFRAHTVGDINEFETTEKERICENIVRMITHLGKKNSYLFVIQTQKDRNFTVALKKFTKEKTGIDVQIVENYDPVMLIDLYRGIDLLIGMRLHSIILATSTGTPAFGYFYKEWGLKNPGLMKKLNLPYLDSQASVSESFPHLDRLLEEKQTFSERVQDLKTKEKNYINKFL